MYNGQSKIQHNNWSLVNGVNCTNNIFNTLIIGCLVMTKYIMGLILFINILIVKNSFSFDERNKILMHCKPINNIAVTDGFKSDFLSQENERRDKWLETFWVNIFSDKVEFGFPSDIPNLDYIYPIYKIDDYQINIHGTFTKNYSSFTFNIWVTDVQPYARLVFTETGALFSQILEARCRLVE